MKWKTTWLLLALVVVLFAFIWLVERRTQPTLPGARAPVRLLAIPATDVTGMQLRRTNQLVLWAERTNATWNLTFPFVYPAQVHAIDGLLHWLENLESVTRIPLVELPANRRGLAEFGLDAPQATLTLQHGGRRTELLFGNKTPVGDQVYVQLLTAPEIHVISAELFDRLPRGANDWRDNALLNLNSVAWNRLEVRAANRGFAIQLEQTNRAFVLTKPTPGRADVPKLEALLRKLVAATVIKFENDHLRGDLEPYGLQTPEAELAFGLGTNDVLVVHFGKSPTNDPSVVFARRLAHNNIVQVPKTLLDALQTPHTELRDRHLMTFAPTNVTAIEVLGPDKFAVRLQTNGSWLVTEPQPMLADTELVREWLDLLARLEGGVEKDVVTDFAAPYGLVPPARQILLKTAGTNATGGLTNLVIAQLDLGARLGEKIFARRLDEDSVYSLSPADYERLPEAAWQLRDRRVFNFTTNQVSRVSIRQRGYTRQLARSGAGEWSLAPGSQGVINTFAVEEMVHRLGELRAAVWVARGPENRALYGFTESGHKLTIELKNGDQPTVLTLEFGGRAPSQYPYALATVDGQMWIFEFPLTLHFQLLRDLANPALSGGV